MLTSRVDTRHIGRLKFEEDNKNSHTPNIPWTRQINLAIFLSYNFGFDFGQRDKNRYFYSIWKSPTRFRSALQLPHTILDTRHWYFRQKLFISFSSIFIEMQNRISEVQMWNATRSIVETNAWMHKFKENGFETDHSLISWL